jgi:cytochrome c biogenesis protein CcdA
MSAPTRNHLTYRYLILIGVVLLLAFTGYAAFALYPRFALPTSAGSGLLLLAIMAGLASLFSPCSFPLLITLLAREASTQSRRSLFRIALAFTMGVMLFLIMTGTILALGAGQLISKFTFTSTAGRFLRLVVGFILIGFGLWQIRGRSLNFVWLTRLLQPLWRTQSKLQRQKTTWSFGLYGFGYILAGFG